MTDFESRVRETLKAGSEDAPPPDGLAEGARQRWRKRRRTTAAVVATGVVLAAVPVGIAVVGGDESSPSKKDTNVFASDLPPIPDGWRWESWHDFQLAVPGDWEPGNASQWCVGDAPAAGSVDRGEGVSTLVACSPGVSSSVTFREGVAKHPLIDIQGVGQRLEFPDYFVDVVAPDQETLDAIMATTGQFEEADSRGCAPTLQELAGSPSADESGALTVCRYRRGLTTDPSVLIESRDLTEEVSATWLAVLNAVPAVSESSNACDVVGGEALLVSSSDGLVAFIEADACGGGFVQTGDGEKAISMELLAPLGSQLTFPG